MVCEVSFGRAGEMSGLGSQSESCCDPPWQTASLNELVLGAVLLLCCEVLVLVWALGNTKLLMLDYFCEAFI